MPGNKTGKTNNAARVTSKSTQTEKSSIWGVFLRHKNNHNLFWYFPPPIPTVPVHCEWCMHYHYDIAFLTGKWSALDLQERKCEQVRSLLLLCSRPTPWILHFFLECSLPRMHCYHNFYHWAFLNITVHIAALPCNIFLFVVHKVQVLLICSLKQKKNWKIYPVWLFRVYFTAVLKQHLEKSLTL